MKNILFIPIDNRPVTYCLVKQIVAINKNLKLILPKRKFFGDLTTPAEIGCILNFIKKIENIDLMVLSLDTLIYGGLVPSRKGVETYEEINLRLQNLKEILLDKKAKNPNLKIYATSSIMRISNNNINEEEKEYWNPWGEAIFKYSYEIHKNGAAKTDVPQEILKDYLQTRERNFKINQIYIDWLKDKTLDFLVFSKDDTGKYGLNVQEALILEDKTRGLPALVKTGADEIPLSLLLRGLAGDAPLKISIKACYEKSLCEISRYEDISVLECAKGQVKIGVKNAIITNDAPNIILFLNNFYLKQGDLVFLDNLNRNNIRFRGFKTPYIVADINNANGADDSFVKKMFDCGLNDCFLGYAGWNTSANTIGSALCAGVIAYLAKQEGAFNKKAFKKLQWTRLMDDWAYQANIRKKIQTAPDKQSALIKAKLDFEPYENQVNRFLKTRYKGEYSLPWKRSFEIEVKMKTKEE